MDRKCKILSFSKFTYFKKITTKMFLCKVYSSELPFDILFNEIQKNGKKSN